MLLAQINVSQENNLCLHVALAMFYPGLAVVTKHQQIPHQTCDLSAAAQSELWPFTRPSLNLFTSRSLCPCREHSIHPCAFQLKLQPLVISPRRFLNPLPCCYLPDILSGRKHSWVSRRERSDIKTVVCDPVSPRWVSFYTERAHSQSAHCPLGALKWMAHQIFMSVSLFYTYVSVFQAVEELLESLELEKSSYHMGLSRVSNAFTL